MYDGEREREREGKKKIDFGISDICVQKNEDLLSCSRKIYGVYIYIYYNMTKLR